MLRDVTTDVAGWFFLSSGLMLWGSWVPLPRRLAMFFRGDDFHAIGARLQLWPYPVHLFGVVVSALTLAALLAVAAMALTMALPDHWALYTPVFHLQALWLAATGASLLWYGLGQGM
jgi:hypothetical protein